jgi:hypothetical protein
LHRIAGRGIIRDGFASVRQLPAWHPGDGGAVIRAPTTRQIEIFRLRCQGLSNAEIGRRLGIRRNSADYAARIAATRLIRARPTLENAADQALAVEHFPEIAKRFAATE